MAAGLIIIPTYMPALDQNGRPLSGAKMQFYEDGTTIPAPVYQDLALTVLHANPVEANAAGAFPPIYASDQVIYTVVVMTRNNAPLDSFAGVVATVTGGATSFTQGSTGAVARTPNAKMAETISYDDFADPDLPIQTNIANAIAKLNTTGAKIKNLEFAGGEYTVPSAYGSINLGDGSVSGPSSYHGVRFVGRGGTQERQRRGLSLSRQMTVFKWDGGKGGSVIKVNGPIAGAGIIDILVDGGIDTDDAPGYSNTIYGSINGADTGIEIKSSNGGFFRAAVMGCRKTLVDVSCQAVPDATIVATDGYASRATADNYFKLTLDGSEYADGLAVTCLKVDGWANPQAVANSSGSPDTCKNIFDLIGIVNRTVRTTAALEFTESFDDVDASAGRGGIFADWRYCDSNKIASYWCQSAGDFPGLGTSSVFRGCKIDGDGAAYPVHNSFEPKSQLGQYVPVRTDSASNSGTNRTACVPGVNRMGWHEVDGEVPPKWPVTRSISGSKPERVGAPAPLNMISRWGLSDIRDEDRNSIINSSFERATRGTTFTNPANNARLLDGVKLERDGTGASVVSQIDITEADYAVLPFGPRKAMRVVKSDVTGETYYTLNWTIENLARFCGHFNTFSIWAKTASGTASLSLAGARIFGSGGSSDDIFASSDAAQTATATWKRLSWRVDVASLVAKTLGNGLDDALKLVLALPASVVTVDLAMPQFEWGEGDSPWYRREPAEEELIAARYLHAFPAASGEFMGVCEVIDANTLRWVYQLNVPMRIAPAIVKLAAGTLYFRTMAYTDAISINMVTNSADVVLQYSDQRMVIIDFTITGHGKTVGQRRLISTSSPGNLTLSAEL